jgi:hypothetical protein
VNTDSWVKNEENLFVCSLQAYILCYIELFPSERKVFTDDAGAA